MIEYGNRVRDRAGPEIAAGLRAIAASPSPKVTLSRRGGSIVCESSLHGESNKKPCTVSCFRHLLDRAIIENMKLEFGVRSMNIKAVLEPPKWE